MAEHSLQTLGVFSQPSYLTIGDEYDKPHSHASNEKDETGSKAGFTDTRHKGKQFMTSPTKKGQIPSVYFDTQFKPLFEGDQYVDPGTTEKEYRKKEKAKNIGPGVFKPSSPSKRSTGLGTNFGCIGAPFPHEREYDVVQKGDKPAKVTPQPKNILTSPAKKGTYGVPGITIGKEYEHQTDPYDAARQKEIEERKLHDSKRIGAPFKAMSHSLDYFDPKIYTQDKPLPPPKEPATPEKHIEKPFKPSSPPKRGLNSTFSPFPSYAEDPYDEKEKREREERKANKPKTVFRPVSGPKSTPTKSIIFKSM